jgi:hypothetical protein
MSKSGALKVVNALLAVLIVTQMASGFFGRDIGMRAFNIIHRDGAIVLMVVAVAHIYLNWNWVKSAFKR